MIGPAHATRLACLTALPATFAAALTAAGTYPDQVVAAASFHGGRLATDAPDSPHRLASKMKARVYVAGAIEDASFPDDMKARLDDALTSGGVRHTIETYPAKHGWVFQIGRAHV